MSSSSSGVPATAIATDTSMDPLAELPAGEPLILAAMQPSAPFGAGQRMAVAPGTTMGAPKPLRPRKERQPVATAIDSNQIQNASVASLRTISPQPQSVVLPVMVSTFPGGQDNGTSIPPDTSGAVGPQHVFNPLNDNVSIFDRHGSLLSTLPLDDFWAALGLNGSTFDPRVVYDPYEKRFVFVTMADAGQPTSSLYVAVSETSDPTQNWIADAIQVDDQAQGPVWLDYPSLGFTVDKVTIQVNLFTRADNRFAGSAIYVFDKRSLYDPPHQAAVQRFILRNQGGTHVPAITYDPSVDQQYLLARWSGNLQGDGFLVAYAVTGSIATGQAQINRIGFIAAGGATWDSFPPGDFGPQAGIANKIDVGDDRLLSVFYRNGILYCSHTVMLPAGGAVRSAVQWWEIDATSSMSVNMLARVDDATGGAFYAFPTLAVNSQNDLLLGLAHFSAATHPSAAYVYRPAGGAIQPPLIFAAGGGTYFKTFNGPANRWGDYSSTQVDPVNDRDFWTVQEYAKAPADTWGTMWALITVPSASVVSTMGSAATDDHA
jgi:hypothetical protein